MDVPFARRSTEDRQVTGVAQQVTIALSVTFVFSERMMDAFAQRYCECNLSIFESPGRLPRSWSGPRSLRTRLRFQEACYVVSFAIIMLNTNLHNASVKDKQSIDNFVKMCRDTAKSDLNEQMLRVRCLRVLGWGA